MKKKIVVVLSLVLCLMLSISLAACNKNKHEAKTEWKFDNAQHWHECATKGHDDKLDEADHTWNDGVVTTEPTEAAEGVKTFTCTVCGQTKIEPVAKLPHTHTFDTSAWEKDENKHWHKATCGHDVKKDEADHTWNDGVVTTEPTEAAEGVKTFTCTVCGQTKTEPVAKLAHTHTFDTANWETNDTHHWHKATCSHTDEKNGYEEHKGEWTTKTEAGYGVNKVEERTCTVCGKHQERTVENSALAAKDNTVTVGTIDFTYNAKPQPIDSLVTAGNKAGMVIKYVGVDGTEYAESTTAPTNAGTYQYTITIPATAEWKAAEISGKFTIEKYELTLLYKKQTIEYDGKAEKDGTKRIWFRFNTLEDNTPVNIAVIMDSANVGAKVSSIWLPELLKTNNYMVDKDKVQIEIVPKKLGSFDLKVTAIEVPDGTTGEKVITFVLDSKVIAGDKGKVAVIVTFNAQDIWGTTWLDLTTGDLEQGKAKIEFKTDGDSEAYLNYEFDIAIGGRGGPDGINEMHDGKGMRFSKKNIETEEVEIAVNLKWEQVAVKIADLIDGDNYLNEREQKEYATLVRFREERQSAKDDDDLVKIIARQIVEYGTAHTYCEQYSDYPDYLGESMQFYTQHYEEVNAELIKFDEVKSVGKGNIYPYSSPNILFKLPYCPVWQAVEERDRQRAERVKEYVDRFTRQCADEYKPSYDKTVVLSVKSDEMPEREYLFLKDHREDFTKYFLKQKGVENVDLSMQRIEITFDRKYIESLIAGNEQTPEERGKIRKIANAILAEGIKESTEGNYCSFFEDFKDNENFVRSHKNEIAEELCRREEVSDVEMTDDGFDVNYYTQYLWNYKDEQEDSTAVSDLDAEEDEEWENRIESGEITPIEPIDESTKESNTDLTKIGFEQSELGGAKQRFKNNIEAIKLVNRLINTQKEATADEKKVLAKYVGWGGLAQAFDEHNVAWQNEYKELKDVLSVEEYAAAKGSVLNAHYTSKTVIDGIYKALTRFGVKGNNRILEPAMGTGNFFGFMPKEIADGAKLYGVELDRVTGKIATKLYPQAKIQIKGFEETAFKDNSFDLMVTNVPFGGYTVFDPDYNKYNFYIHDYFIAKGIDKIKPNGLMAVITSKGTMDKQNPSIRKYIADRAELVGAIRLPNTAFKQTANTEVVTDILFFRKREEKINATIENTEWLATGKTEEGYEINNYYIAHPEMVLGTLAKETGLYGAEDITVKPDGRDLSEAINAAISRLPQGFYVNPEYSEEAESGEEVEVDYDVKPMNLKAVNGKLYMRVGDSMVEQPVPSFPKDAYQRIVEMIAIRKQLRKVLDLQVEGCSDDVLTREQWQLGARYDMFVKRFGYINSKNNLRLFKPDGDSALLFACENVSEDEATVRSHA